MVSVTCSHCAVFSLSFPSSPSGRLSVCLCLCLCLSLPPSLPPALSLSLCSGVERWATAFAASCDIPVIEFQKLLLGVERWGLVRATLGRLPRDVCLPVAGRYRPVGLAESRRAAPFLPDARPLLRAAAAGTKGQQCSRALQLPQDDIARLESRNRREPPAFDE